VFLNNSRYFNLKTVDAEDSQGRLCTAVTLRRLPFTSGTPTLVMGYDRLDVMAQRRYSDATTFWHIADSNTELDANDLLKQRPQIKEARVISVPEK